MTKRLLSLILVVVMLLGVCISTASCVMLEEYIGYENLPEDYLDKYYPDGVPGAGDSGNNNQGGTGNNQGGTGNNNQGNDGGNTVVIPNEHASYAVEREGYNLVTFYWYNKYADLETSDLWIWWDGEGGDLPARLWEECDYGGRVTVSVPDDVVEIGFIPRTDCTEPGGSSWGNATKDCGPDDLFATVEGKDTFIYLVGGKNDPNQYHSNDGGKTLTVIKKFNLVGMVDKQKLEYIVTPAVKITSIDQIKVFDGDREIKVSNVSSLTRFSTNGIITLEEELDITKNYTVQIEGFDDTRPVVPTDIFDTPEFAAKYHYSGNDLGATINSNGTTTFKVWAPTASKVVLNLFASGHEDSDSDVSYEMKLGDKGVWTYTANCGHGTYYTYSVTTSLGTQEAVDPYAKSAGLNGNRGMVIDLDSTDPEGWAEDQKFNTGIDSYDDAIVWEIHVRDFSNTIKSSQYKGKYLAFTEKGLVNENGIPVGIDYLKALGVNFVHLLPVYDYATVKEENPDSGFNWGYDPKNYNVPEGSYSTDPYNGEVRVKEFKQMVMALHEAGIGVVMDVVYNHTFDKNASFNRIVPYYYYRYKSNGANSSGSGCGNDTASERYMFGKFMVESTSYWMDEYNLDGFRFDLMGLHDTKTMQAVESAVHKLNPQAILYGEGWDMIQNSYDKTVRPASQKYISEIKPTNGGIGAVAVFNDVIRTGLKGESDDASKGYINGKVDDYTRKRVLFGVNGGADSIAGGADWQVSQNMVVNYLSAHDNCTLWDKLTIANGSSSVDTRLKMNRLGATILFVSKGIVFFQAGEEMLRTKPKENTPHGYDHNSYKSSDEINNLKWDTLKEGSNEYNMFKYYAGLVAIRRGFDIFTNQKVSFKTYNHDANKGFNIILDDGNGGKAVVVVNPHAYAIDFGLPGNGSDTYHLVCNGSSAGITAIGDAYKGGDSLRVSGYSAYIFVNTKVLNNAKPINPDK